MLRADRKSRFGAVRTGFDPQPTLATRFAAMHYMAVLGSDIVGDHWSDSAFFRIPRCRQQAGKMS